MTVVIIEEEVMITREEVIDLEAAAVVAVVADEEELVPAGMMRVLKGETHTIMVNETSIMMTTMTMMMRTTMTKKKVAIRDQERKILATQRKVDSMTDVTTEGTAEEAEAAATTTEVVIVGAIIGATMTEIKEDRGPDMTEIEVPKTTTITRRPRMRRESSMLAI